MKPEKRRPHSLRALSRTIIVLFTVNLFILALLIYLLFRLPGQLNQFTPESDRHLNDAEFIPLERMVIFYRNEGKAACSLLAGIFEHRESKDYPSLFRRFLPPHAGMVHEFAREDSVKVIAGEFQINHIVVFASAEGRVLMVLKPEDSLGKPAVSENIKAKYIIQVPREIARRCEISTEDRIWVKWLTGLSAENFP